jgi:protocatechuate 3,4-dioxygenase beta subunit
MKRRVAAAVAVVLALLLVVLWRMHAGGTAKPATAASVAGQRTTLPAGAKPRDTADPRTMPRGSISGMIRDEAGAPIAHARVCASASSQELPSALTRVPTCIDSDDQGRYRAGNLLATSYTVSAAAPRFIPAEFRPAGTTRRELPLAAGENKTGIDLVLRKGGVEITGVVLDISGGPIAHAQVRAASRQSRLGVVVDTDDQGRFAMWVARGPVAVEASADGYADGDRQGSAPGRFEILLTPEGSLAGTVVDAASDQPIAGARVTAWGLASASYYDMSGSDVSDGDGKFRVEHLPPGRFLTTATHEHGYGRSDGSTQVGVGQHVDGLVVRVFPARHIEGRVVIAGDRTPCPRPYVVLTDRVRNRTAVLRGDTDPLVANGVVPGTYDVTVNCERYRVRDHYDPVIVADRDVTGLVWEVDAGARIHGKLTTRSGDPVDGARLVAQRVSGAARDRASQAYDVTRPDGSYELAGVAPGTYRITAITERGISPEDGFTVEVADRGDAERDLVLDDGGSMTGTVVDTTGKPVPDVSVTAMPVARNLAFGPDRATTGADGGFAIDTLRAGAYRLTARRGNEVLRRPGISEEQPQGERVTVRAGQTATVRLVVDAASGAISGSVVDSAGKPVPDAFIAASRESEAAGARSSNVLGTRIDWWGDDRPVLTSPDGSFQVTGLAPGKYTLRAYRKGGGEAFAEHVAVGGTARLQIKPTASLEGTVRRDAGPPPRDLQLSLRNAQTGFERTESFYQTQGRFRVADLPAGHFEITARGDGGLGSVTIDLGEGEARTGVDIKLAPLVSMTGRIVDLATHKPVPGIMVFAASMNAGMAFAPDDDPARVSDEAGRFSIANAPVGTVAIRGFPKDWQGSDYDAFRIVRTVDAGGGTSVDIGDIGIVKQRIKKGDPIGVLGIRYAAPAPDAPPDGRVYQVSCSPGSPTPVG